MKKRKIFQDSSKKIKRDIINELPEELIYSILLFCLTLPSDLKLTILPTELFPTILWSTTTENRTTEKRYSKTQEDNTPGPT